MLPSPALVGYPRCVSCREVVVNLADDMLCAECLERFQAAQRGGLEMTRAQFVERCRDHSSACVMCGALGMHDCPGGCLRSKSIPGEGVYFDVKPDRFDSGWYTSEGYDFVPAAQAPPRCEICGARGARMFSVCEGKAHDGFNAPSKEWIARHWR